jgi:hypothetical protein
MEGDERVRFCPQCQLNVYNFSELSAIEINQVISRSEGRLCARFYQRSDGTMLTRNCPIGSRGVVFRASRMAGAALTALVSMVPIVTASVAEKRNAPLLQIHPVQSMFEVEVSDPAGAVIRDAQITIVNESTGYEVAVKTDATGRIRVSNLPSGSYEITIRANGFDTLKQVHVAIPASDVLKFQLSIAALMGEVVVIEESLAASALPSSLSEPVSARPDSAKVSTGRENFLRKLLSSLRRLF